MDAHPRFLNAGNAGPFTLDGTRTFRIGHRNPVVLDPGPDVDDHVRALRTWLADASTVRVVVTHGHPDHFGAAPALADALGVPVAGPVGQAGVDRPLGDGVRLDTEEGTLVAVETPGHARHHLCFHWLERDAVFVGDLFLGRGDTTWVGEYPGCVADYLASLERIRQLKPRVLYPAHGPPVENVPATLDRYEAHRRVRIEQVAEVLRTRPDASAEDLVVAVYGTELPSAVQQAARMSFQALKDHVLGHEAT